MAFISRGVIVATCLLALAACDTSEERAEKHFQSGLEMLEAGDYSRAIVEFRNVLALDSSHREARVTYARAARDIGNIPEAYSNYLRIAEEFPDDMEARLALSEMSIVAQNWDEAERHGAALVEAQSELEGTAIVDVALRFRTAALADDRAQVREIVREAEALAKENPNNQILSRLLVEGYMVDQRIDDALAVTTGMIETDTENPIFYQVKAELLFRKGDADQLEQLFRQMVQKFPDDDENKGRLIRLLISEGRGDSAEDFLREEIAAADDKIAAHVSLISLIRQLRGDDAALAEIETALATYDDPALMSALKAGLLFDRGERDTAVALMQSITEGQEPSKEIDDYRVTLAKMLIATGNEVGARQLVEAVLEHDPSQVEALKMQASWQIEADESDAAIATLRLALDQAPDDSEAMTIMARAHERNGDAQLAQDLLALAVEASVNAPGESIRFAQVLIAQERYSTAEEILINSLRRTPRQPDLLNLLGTVYLETADWPRAEQVANTLRDIELPGAKIAADNLQLQIISRREGRQQGVGFLEQLVQSNSDDTAALIALIQARLQENRGTDALELAEKLVADRPNDPQAGMVLGNTHLALADFEQAENAFRSVIELDGNNSVAILQLLRTMTTQGRVDEGRALVEDALGRMPENPDLLWARASFQERDNDIDGAIATYEQLYAQNTNVQLIANNLASLLVTYKEDETNLARAFTVGKRLRGTDFPPFQDTYGWILYRQGAFEEAITYLEPAARALSQDPIVQFHLGKAYLAVGRDQDALAQFELVGTNAAEDDPRAQIAEAKSEVERLKAASE